MADLSTVFKNIAQTMINDIFPGIPISITYHSLGSQTYNPETGTITESGGSDTQIAAIRVKDKRFEEETNDRWSLVKEGDNLEDIRKTILIADNDISFTPSNKDYWTDDEGTWENIEVKTDPVKATWRITGRLKA